MRARQPVALLLCFVASAAFARSSSLYHGRGPRPGPDVLYAPPAAVPQLENAGIWSAPPILVSGASAYRGGEFLYQDFLYDDHGATQAPDPTDPRAAGNTFSRPNGTYTYPTDAAYANDAADLVELRVKPLADATAFRVTLNTLKDPSRVAFSIALGGVAGETLPFPAGANVRAPAELFLTVHPAPGGMIAELTNAVTGLAVAGTPPLVAVDAVRRQIEVRVARAAWDPGNRIVRLAAGVGLWDGASGRYLLPGPVADASHPGGAGAALAPAAFFNVAFRYDEPMPDVGDPAGTATGPAWWRDEGQGAALAAGDLSRFHADVDFRKLAASANDDMPDQPGGVPETGPMDRILASRFEVAQGADFSVSCFPASEKGGSACPGQYQGALQPYAIYVPPTRPRRGYGMTLLLHSLSAPYNQYLGSRNQSQFGDRGGGSIVVTPESRGPDGFYDGYAGAEVFEVWADVARLYRLDPDWTVVTGYSMGGIGTFKLAEQFPDLFARAQPTVGFSADDNLVPSLRNIPFLMWNSAVDELVPATDYEPTARRFDDLGYRYELDVFQPGDHLTLAINDQFAPAAAFLDGAKVDRDPAHVTYVVDPTLDYAALGFVADHAYWLSGLTLRDPTPPLDGHAQGTIDARSWAFRVGDPTPSGTQLGAGTLTGGNLPFPLTFTSQAKTWGPVPRTPAARRLDLIAQNIATVTVDVRRAKVGCNVDLHVVSDGPITIQLDPCRRTVQAGG